jgi:hypothetical protein
MKTRFAVVIVISSALCLGLESAAEAATYYVSGTGYDVYTCAQAQNLSAPKQTINSAVSCLSAGDTLFVRGGTYAESLIGNVPSGTSWTAKVRVAAYNGETVWMRPGTGAERVLYFTGTQHYIEIDGINLDGTNVRYDTVKILDGLPGEGSAHHIRFQNLEAIGPAHTGTGSPTGMTFIAAAGDATAIGGNEFINLRVHGGLANDFDHHFYVQSPGNLFDHLDVYDFPGSAFEFYNANGLGAGANNNILRNSRIHDDRHNVSGQRHSAIVITYSGNRIYNNLIYNIKSDGASCIGISVYSGDATEVYNNTVYNVEGIGIRVDPDQYTAVIRNNIAYQNSTGNYVNSGTGTIASNNLFTADPMFGNASAANFQLRTGSPAIDTGLTIPIVTTDMAATPRPQGGAYDIGAYEYGSQTTVSAPVPPPPPTGLRILTQ